MTLKDLFDQTRKVYSRSTPFIDITAIQLPQPQQQEIIRKANIATFISSILGAHDVSFYHLNEYFIETFVPQGHRLLKWQGAMYLELKTQTYISALINSDGSPENMLEELFPSDLDSQILARHPDAPSMSPSEQDFIDRCRARKSYLLDEPSAQDAVRELPRKYQWNDFIREFAACINKNADSILNVPSRQQTFLGALADRRGLNGAQATLDTSATQASAIEFVCHESDDHHPAQKSNGPIHVPSLTVAIRPPQRPEHTPDRVHQANSIDKRAVPAE